jgi:hypothetical protein
LVSGYTEAVEAESRGSRWKAATLVLSLALIAALFLDLRSCQTGPFRQFDSAAVITQVRQLNQLVTVRYSIQRVVGLTEAKQPVGEESILLMVQGEADAGVDLAHLTRDDISYISERSVQVVLPPARLFNTYLDEKQTKVWDRHITWWTPWVPYDPDLEHKARLQGLADVRKAALEMGILDQAQKNAESAVRDLLGTFGIEVKFRRPSL